MRQEQSPTIFYSISLYSLYGLPCWLSVKESTWRHRFDPWLGKIPWRRKWQPTPVFLPGKSHGPRNLVGYSPWGHKRVWHDLATKQQCALFTNEKHGIQQNKNLTNCLPPSEQQSLNSRPISILFFFFFFSILHDTVCLQHCIFIGLPSQSEILNLSKQCFLNVIWLSFIVSDTCILLYRLFVIYKFSVIVKARRQRGMWSKLQRRRALWWSH